MKRRTRMRMRKDYHIIQQHQKWLIMSEKNIYIYITIISYKIIIIKNKTKSKWNFCKISLNKNDIKKKKLAKRRLKQNEN